MEAAKAKGILNTRFASFPPYCFGFSCRAIDMESPDQGLRGDEAVKTEQIAGKLRDYYGTKMPGHYPFSFAYYSDGMVFMQNHFKETSKKYLSMGQQREGEIKERQIITFVIDRIKGHVFILKNGKLLSQDVNDQEGAKKENFLSLVRTALAKEKAGQNRKRNQDSHDQEKADKMDEHNTVLERHAKKAEILEAQEREQLEIPSPDQREAARKSYASHGSSDDSAAAATAKKK